MNGMPDELRDYYADAEQEDVRVREGLGQLELVRVRAIVQSHLPHRPLRILDVGGGTGVHAEWLLADGHRVHLVDPAAPLVDIARRRLGDIADFTADIGDARDLSVPDDSFDVVLLFGPLYHLGDRKDRVRVWREAARALRSDGLAFGMGISRFASLFDGLAHGYLFDRDFRNIVENDLLTGQHRNPTGQPGWFTTSYFHHPDELALEAEEAGLRVRDILGVEGIAPWIRSLQERWAEPEGREAILFSAEATASERVLLGLSPHLLLVAGLSSSA
jgi:SAM-dependent methyltransferase